MADSRLQNSIWQAWGWYHSSFLNTGYLFFLPLFSYKFYITAQEGLFIGCISSVSWGGIGLFLLRQENKKKGHFVSMNPWGLCLIPVLTFQLTFDVVRRWCHSWKPIGSPQIKWRQLFWCLLLMGNGEKQAYSAKTLVLSSLLSEMFVVEKLSCWFSQHNGFRSIEFFTLKTFI